MEDQLRQLSNNRIKGTVENSTTQSIGDENEKLSEQQSTQNKNVNEKSNVDSITENESLHNETPKMRI